MRERIAVSLFLAVVLSGAPSQDAGARARVLAPGVGAVKEADTYMNMVDYNVRTLADGLR